jgi:6-pyruvoyltetrahydropterin/6-carboxytetrahydropterin synthase
MGHRLPNHPGGCRNLHGHSYRMRVEIEGEPGADGMIIDFDDVSAAVRPAVDALDHAFLVEAGDEALVEFLRTHELKYVLTDDPTTVEHICIHLAEQIRPALAARENVQAFTVVVHETETSSAEVTVPVSE